MFKGFLYRQNAFVALCKHDTENKILTFENCHLFKRSFTNKGIGFTYNIAKAADLIKKTSNLDETKRIS